MKLAVVFFTSERTNSGIELLRETMAHYRWPEPIILIDDNGFQGHPHKLNTVYKALPKLKASGYTHVLYTDCWDVICVGGIGPVLQYIHDPSSPKMLLSGDAGFWGDGIVTAEDFDNLLFASSSRWRYINGGGWIGEISFLIDYLKDCHTETVNDQWYLSRKYIGMHTRDVEIDRSCRIFQCLSQTPPEVFYAEHGAVYNRETGTTPPLIHGAGGTVMDWVPTVGTKWKPIVRNF